MIRAFSPGSTTQRQFERPRIARPPRVKRLLNLLAMIKYYILIQMMQENYTKFVSGYKLTDRKLGSGSFSQVFLAYACDKRRLAVKVIPRSQILETEIRYFQSEVSLLRNLKHQNIVELIDVKKSQHNFYLFLEYCQGGSLAQYIKNRRHLPQTQAMKIFGQIIRGLSIMHQFKVMHRDLKPSNILLKNGKVKIADFGLATKFSKNQMLRTFAGTPLNMAPQILKGQFYNQKVDIYSAGTVLYEMLYGVMPFKGRDTRSLIQSIQRGRMTQTNINISLRTQNLLRNMLQAEPQNRIQLHELLDVLCDYELQRKKQKVEQYRNLCKANVINLGATGALSCGFDLSKSSNSPSQMDMRLYNKFCRKLSQQIGVEA